MTDAFGVKRPQYAFAFADYQRNASSHEREYPLYVKCAMIVLLKKGTKHDDILKEAIQLIDEEPTIYNTDNALEMIANKIVF